ncbi:hypothetical protein [Pantoea agglomerans]|uniref:hypothetical protein n=1 Tax=Enterobacter agglomerans TaxID=549 RepID=UPI003FD14F91
MRKGIPVLLCIILFSAISYADEKMVCYVPKKPEHKPVLPVKRHNIESKEVSIDNDTSSISSDLTSQSSQVFINLPQNLCNRGKGGDNEGNSEVSFELWKYFLEFIIKVLSIGTWPLVLFLVVKRFAPELKEIIPRVKTASGAGFSVELHKLNDKFNDINEDVTQEQEIKSNIDARSTIISAWLNIEAKLNKLLESRYNSTKTGITPNHG